MAKLTDNQMAQIKYIRDGLRISKVVATRAAKTKNGDFFVGFSSAWDSTQEDAGGLGADLIGALTDAEQHQAIVTRAFTLKGARIAGLILGMEVDIQAVTHALCGGAITEEEFLRATKAIKRNYMTKLSETVVNKPAEGGDGEAG